MKSRLALRYGIGVCLTAASVAADPGTPARCVPREGEKLGIRFVELCSAHTSDFADAEAHAEQVLPPFWIAAIPTPCSPGEHGTVPCDPATALEASPGGGSSKNAAQGALLVSAYVAHRTCALRFGGRLPTPLEREHARRSLGLASMLARQASEAPSRIRIDDLPEWVEEGDCAGSPSVPGPGCRITQFPPVVARPRTAGDVLFACAAEENAAARGAARLGRECGARVAVDGSMRLDCAIRVADAGPAYALHCRAISPLGGRPPSADLAAFRCVLPESALGHVGP